MTHPAYRHLFEPIRIGPVTVRNRLYMTAHGLGYAVPNPAIPGACLPSDRHLNYYAERAAGGVGLIIQESTTVHPSSLGSAFGYQTATVAAAYDSNCVPHFARIADAVHAHGAKMFMQLWHGGHHADPRWEIGGPRRAMVSSSPTPAVESNRTPRGLTIPEIADIVEGFAASALNARLAGYDGVEIQAGHSALVEQFLSPFYNRRTDAYGGTPGRRMRFLNEIIEAIRGKVGTDIALGLRLNTDELLTGGLSAEDCAEIARGIDETGRVDFFDLDIGTMHTAPLMIAPSFVPPLPAEDFIAELRPSIRNAVVMGCPGRMTDPAEADRLIAEDKMQMIGSARTFIAEPEFVNNAKAGRHDRNRICIACNHCLEGILSGVNCVINPATGREAAWGRARGKVSAACRKVLVVGGGPAGLEAARVAAVRGHDVTLFEKEPDLGGALRMAAQLPGRESYAEAIDWYRRSLHELNVDVRLGTELQPADLMRLTPDIWVVATGARFEFTGATGFLNQPIEGWDLPHVYTPERFLSEMPRVSGKAVVLDEDGQSSGVGIAEILAQGGAQVEIVTRWQLVAPLLQASGQFAHVLARLYTAGVVLTPNTYLSAISADKVTVFNIFTGEERIIDDVECVVIAGSRIAADNGWQTRSRSPVHVIGDALAPRGFSEATYEGARIAHMLD